MIQFSLANRVAVVTGAGGGYGRAVALALGAAGARVAVNDINPDGAQRTAVEIMDAGGTAVAYAADVSNKLGLQTMFYSILEKWERIDILVNAAVVRPQATLLKCDEYEWDRCVGVNLKGVFLCTQTAVRAMASTGGGTVIVLQADGQRAGSVAYAASVAGLEGFVAGAARELAGSPVRVELLAADGAPAAVAASVLQACAMAAFSVGAIA